MYPVSDSFLNAIRKSGKRKIVADLYFGSSIIPSITDLPVIDGTITVDRGSRSRRSGSITIGDPSMFPNPNDTSGLTPYGAEIGIRCGIVYPNGLEELVPMGMFLITEVGADVSTGMPVVTLLDRAQRVLDTSTHVADSGPQKFVGTTVNQALPEVISYCAPGWPNNPLFSATVHPDLITVTIPGGFLNGETDRWKIVEDMATAIGGEAYFDVFGEGVCNPIPSITSETTVNDAVWTVDCGTDGVFVEGSMVLTRENTYNAVLILGATPDEGKKQPYGLAKDTNSLSKTNYDGLFGKKTLRISNQLITRQCDAQDAAKEQLKNVLGLSKNVSFESLSNPALDVGDIILVVYPDGTQELHLLDSISFQFGSSWSMTATTRTIQYSS